MAMDYEDRYSKRQILGQYLNTATYGTNAGDTAVGVEAASQVYFNKHVSDLSVKESALLAGLPQAPSQYNPFINPERATQRRNLVLNAMQEQGYIDAAEYQRLVSDDLGLERGERYDEIREQYFFDYVQQELIEEYGTDTVRLGGLEVHTTIDPELQELARKAIAAHPVESAAAALVSTDTQTGEILAMASSTTYETDQFNLAAQGERQPGSAFKPFALTAAVEQGIDPDSTYYAAPSTITLTPCDGCPPWTVSGGGGTMNLRNATAESINTVFAQLVLDIGADAMVETAKKMGITAELGGYPAEVLGGLTRGVSVLQMSNAYATLANGGVHHEPTAIRRVEFPDGEVDEPGKAPGKRVLQDGVALEVVDVMKGTFDYGTLTCCDIPPCPAAGKTGTTELQSDAWTVGFTPHVSTAVWVGNPDARVPLPGYSFDLAGPIWDDYMSVAAAEPCDDFPEPKDPANLSPGFGSYTVDPNATTTTTGTDETDPDQQTDADGDGVPDDGYDDNLYAPGAGQEPLPTPGGGNPNGGGGERPGAGGGGPPGGGGVAP
jgi:penicillin-binding protein 1A